MPQEFDASSEFKDKKIVLVSVPGAFTPGCQARHIPPYLENLNKIVEKGVDLVVVIAYNDSWVMSAWGKVNGVTGDSKIKFMSDTKTQLSKANGWMAGMGERTGRWAMIIEKDGTISYAEQEDSPRQVTVSMQKVSNILKIELIALGFWCRSSSLEVMSDDCMPAVLQVLPWRRLTWWQYECFARLYIMIHLV